MQVASVPKTKEKNKTAKNYQRGSQMPRHNHQTYHRDLHWDPGSLGPGLGPGPTLIELLSESVQSTRSSVRS